MHTNILRRCGVVLITVGVADIAYMIWFLSKGGQSYSSSFNIFAVIGGIFLLRGSLKAARWIAMIASFMLVACISTIVVMPWVYPIGYWGAVFRNGSGVFVGVCIAIAMVTLLYWLRKELQRPEVSSIQIEAGLKPARTVPPIVGGTLLPVLLMGVLVTMLRGENAREAMRRAEQQLGPGYRYVVTNMQMQSNASHKTVSAVVAAYNDSELKTVRVSWKE